MTLDVTSPFHLTLMGRLRAYFFAGVLITAPISITLYIAWHVIGFVDDRVAQLLPEAYNPNLYLPFAIPGVGLVIAVVFLVLVGWATAGLLGRVFLGLSEGVVQRMPGVRTVYAAVKQIFETVLAQRATMFRKVVLVEFPRRGLWRIGFVTGATPGAAQAVSPGGVVNVFLPGTPNVVSGFLVLVPVADVTEIDLTVEEALRLVVSGGIAVPGAQPDRTSAAAASRSNK